MEIIKLYLERFVSAMKDFFSSGKAAPASTNPVRKRRVVVNPEHEAVASWLNEVHFKHKIVGGLDPDDVWKKLDELNNLYEKALICERARYNLMLRQVIAKRKSEEKNG